MDMKISTKYLWKIIVILDTIILKQRADQDGGAEQNCHCRP